MSEQRLVDAEDLHKRYCCLFEGSVSDSEMDRETYVIASSPTIDPETLPIIQELRAKLSKYEREAEHWKECYAKVVNERWKQHHAHWEPFSKTENRGYRCSHCKKARISNSDYNSVNFRNYCYNCGAKMDLGDYSPDNCRWVDMAEQKGGL